MRRIRVLTRIDFNDNSHVWVRKVVMLSPLEWVVKTKDNSTPESPTAITQLDFRNMRVPIKYRPSMLSDDSVVSFLGRFDRRGEDYMEVVMNGSMPDINYDIFSLREEPAVYPACVYFNSADETNDVELIPTRFIQFPPPETPEETRARLQPIITQIANKLVLGLPHNLVHFGAKAEAICNDVDSRHHLIDRYDNAVNSVKPFIGYIQRLMDSETPDFEVLDGLVAELQEAMPKTIEEMPKLFRKQAFSEWSQTLYYFKVRAGMDLETGLPRRLVYDIGAQEHNIIPMDPPVEDSGEIDREKAGREFYDLSANCFNDAQLSEQDELVTERMVTPLEYFPTQ